MQGTIIGLDIGGTKSVVLEGTHAGEISPASRLPHPPGGGLSGHLRAAGGGVARRLGAALEAGRGCAPSASPSAGR